MARPATGEYIGSLSHGQVSGFRGARRRHGQVLQAMGFEAGSWVLLMKTRFSRR